MIRRLGGLFALVCCSVFANAQTLLERIVDSALVKEQHEFIMSKLDSANMWDGTRPPFELKGIIINEIYYCHNNHYPINVIEFDENGWNPVDTNLFNKNFFISGAFLEDWIDLKERGEVLIGFYSFLFDTIANKAYLFSPKPSLHTTDQVIDGIDTTFQWYGYLIRNCYFEGEAFLGKLFKNNTIDIVFRYPTFVRHYDNSGVLSQYISNDYIFWESDFYFAAKGNQLYFIDMTVDDGDPMIYPLEWVLENHWEWITNVKEK